MESFEALVRRTGELLDRLDDLDADVRSDVFELLDCVDALHRRGLEAISHVAGGDCLARIRQDPAAAWLLDAYALDAKGGVPVQIRTKP